MDFIRWLFDFLLVIMLLRMLRAQYFLNISYPLLVMCAHIFLKVKHTVLYDAYVRSWQS